jgi:hypothetical protein
MEQYSIVQYRMGAARVHEFSRLQNQQDRDMAKPTLDFYNSRSSRSSVRYHIKSSFTTQSPGPIYGYLSCSLRAHQPSFSFQIKNKKK